MFVAVPAGLPAERASASARRVRASSMARCLAMPGWMPSAGQAGAVAEVEEDPGVAGTQVDPQDLRPVQPAPAA